MSFRNSEEAEGFLLVSSSEVYGAAARDGSIDEAAYGFLDPTQVRSCYGEAKRAAEALCVAWNTQFRIPTFIGRLFHTYGPGLKPRRRARFRRLPVQRGPRRRHPDQERRKRAPRLLLCLRRRHRPVHRPAPGPSGNGLQRGQPGRRAVGGRARRAPGEGVTPAASHGSIRANGCRASHRECVRGESRSEHRAADGIGLGAEDARRRRVAPHDRRAGCSAPMKALR